MANLTKSEGGTQVLKMFLDFLVKCTKQDQRLHVLLDSSDSFYQIWLSKFLGSNRFNTFVVGNLSKDEAQKFWKEPLAHGPSFLGPPGPWTFLILGKDKRTFGMFWREAVKVQML